jgi:peptidoglycan/LPS O-acetylase OafA/YrhL
VTESEAALVVRRIYWLALGFGVIGFVFYMALQGWRPAAAFGLGALGSIGNLWIFDKLVHSIRPAAEGEPVKKPWQASIFVVRYILLLLVGYAIVKTLGVNALAVILGLLASTAAVLASTVLELLQNLFVSRSSH